MCNSIGLYIHIPFCKSKCPYCDFYSFGAGKTDYDNYVRELIRKISFWGNFNKKSVATVYFGGGTPSVLGADRLCMILNEINKSFSILPNAEITVEINPDSGKSIDFKALYNAGFNRISIGLQSAVKEELNALARIHSIDDARQTVLRAQNAGIKNISLDLMMGVPHQTIESLERSIEFCAELKVTHISSYILKIEQNTPFDKIKNTLKLPDEDMQAEMYLSAVSLLDKLGYKQYEISNFSKHGFESKHNINYWKCGEYIGIGPSAHSFLDGKRFFYDRNMADFIDNKTVFDCYGGDEEEFIMLALRLVSGIEYNEYKKRFNKDIPQRLINKAKEYEKHGLAKLDDKRLCITPKGFLVSNEIISSLI